MSTTSTIPLLVLKPPQCLAIDEQDRLLKEIFEKRPLLEKLMDQCGSFFVTDFSSSNLTERLMKPDDSRRDELISIVFEIVRDRLGSAISEEIKTQLTNYYVVSTADHHGPICPSMALNSNSIIASAYRKINHPNLAHVIVFSFSCVSQNNPDFPRGIFFQNIRSDAFERQQVSFLPSDSRQAVIYGFRSYKASEIVKAKKLMSEKVRSGYISDNVAQKIFSLFDEVYLSQDVLDSSGYCEQVTRTNFELWKRIFKPGLCTPPALVYLEIEEIVSRLLLEHHIFKDTLIHRMLFDADFFKEAVVPLQTAMAPFVRQGSLNTSLFWGIDSSHYRFVLNNSGDKLVLSDGTCHMDLEPEIIAEALRQKRLMPSMFTVFVVLYLYYQLNCLGGFNQIHYLDAMWRKYHELNIDPLQTSDRSFLFNYGLQSLFLDSGAQIVSAGGLDLLLYGSDELWREVEDNLSQVTVKDALMPTLSEITTILS